MQKGGCRASRRARAWVGGVAWVKSRGRGCWAPRPTCLGLRGSPRPDEGRTPASLSLQGLPAPSPSTGSRCLDVARGRDCYFKKSPWRVWMLSPLVPAQLGRPGGHARGGRQAASGALGLCLGWDLDGTQMGLGTLPWGFCSLAGVFSARAYCQEDPGTSSPGPPAMICPPQGGGGANYRVVPITGLPGQPCGCRCPPPLVSSSKALGNRKGYLSW